MTATRCLAVAATSLLVLAPARAAPPRYELDAAHSSLTFRFVQAGAQNSGRFGRFSVALTLDPAQSQSGRLEVTVQMSSVDTQDKDRDGTLRGPDLFDATRFPQARFISGAIARIDATHYRAAGQLTLRNVTQPLNVDFSFVPAAGGGASMAGQLVLQRLAYGVGQGDWKSTEWVANDVTVSFQLHLR
ncbi:MAG TPA: YceI family protein [Steroidobacteraceae bacterium]|nr:YceI family protein [Steroidobacteraceae bacterium]